MGLSHLGQLTCPLNLFLLTCKMGMPTEPNTSWGFSVWVCPFQLLKQTALLICQRCSINVYYIKNTSVGLRHSGLRPVWPSPLNPEHMTAAGAELPIRSWPAWPCWRTPMHPSRPCSNISVLGTGSCCPSVAIQHSSMDDGSCRELPGHPAQGQAQGTHLLMFTLGPSERPRGWVTLTSSSSSCPS